MFGLLNSSYSNIKKNDFLLKIITEKKNKKLTTNKTCLLKLFRLKSLVLHSSTRFEKFKQLSLKVQKRVTPHEKRSTRRS